MTLELTRKFVPSQAERLKFAPIALSALQALGYPTSSPYADGLDGRYAVFTYDLAPAASVSISGGMSINSISAVNTIVNPVTAVVTSIIPVVTTYNITPDTLWIGTTTVAAGSAITWTGLSPALQELEIQNRTGDSIFFIPSSTTYSGVVSAGIEIFSSTFYSTSRKTTNFTVASISGGDVRILGYY